MEWGLKFSRFTTPLYNALQATMSNHRYINTKFWTDNYIINELNPVEKLIFIYLITNTHTNICGVYELPLKVMAMETGIDRDNLEKVILPKLEKDGKILYKNGWMAVKNFIKHQAVNPSIEKGIKEKLAEAPKELKNFVMDDGTACTQPVPSLPTACIQSVGNLIQSNLIKDTHSQAVCLPNKDCSQPQIGHKNVMTYFHDRVVEDSKTAPVLNGKDGMAVKRALNSYPLDSVKRIIDFYLQSEKVEKFGYNLSTALSKDTINQWIYSEQRLR